MGSLAIERSPVFNMSSPFQRLQSNRSPIESPPIAKKFLRASTWQMMFKPASPTVVDSGKANRSILKRSTDGEVRTRSWHAGQVSSQRKVNFQQEVAVVVYDRADGDYVCSQSQKLNTEPKDRRQFVSRTLARFQSSRLTTTEDDPQQTLYREMPVSSAVKAISAGLSRPLPSSVAISSSESGLGFTFHEDSAGQLWLRFTIALGPGVAAGDALVKANIAGNKVRVLGSRRAASGEGKEDFAMRYALPMDVDPYSISARMDTAGNLFVEAPVMTSNSYRNVGK